MKRPTIAVTITDAAGGDIIHTETRSAWNAAIRASETAMRYLARQEGQLYSGGKPVSTRADRYRPTVGDVYIRGWMGNHNGHLRTATIEIVSVPE